jgi:fibro-slime domain-containing protein
MRKLFAVSSMCLAWVGCANGGTSWDPAEGGNTIALGGDSGINGVGPIGSGDGAGGNGATQGLMVTIRDFKFWRMNDATTNPDFENTNIADDRGIVDTNLGTDHKPVYKNAAGMTPTTHGKRYFDQWYNDTPGVNINIQVPLPLSMTGPGTYGYDSQVSGVTLSAGDQRKMWFPIDGKGWGNEMQLHNYSFTTELHTIFTYKGGESFSFSGDDDVFVFINGSLVIDRGGVHAREQMSVQLDSLGLVKGQQYPLDVFNAERHTNESNFSFTTTLVLQPLPL